MSPTHSPNTALSQPATICRKEDKAQYKDLYDPDKLLQLFTDRFKEKYGVECMAALSPTGGTNIACRYPKRRP